MKYLVSLIIIAAAIGGFMYLNKDTAKEESQTITGTNTTVNEAPEPTTSKTPDTTTTSASKGTTDGTTVKTETTITTTTTTPAPKGFSVSYTDAGFSPSSITISKGDSVTFTNNSNGSMWVASAPHPVHTNYSEFDQKASVAKGAVYTFKFEKVGTWGFHNHLNSSKFGSITVK